MISQKQKKICNSNTANNKNCKPYSILTGLLGAPKGVVHKKMPRVEKVNKHNDVKVKVQDENHNQTNFHPSLNCNDSKRKQDQVHNSTQNKFEIPSNLSFNSTFYKLEGSDKERGEYVKPQRISFQNMTNCMIEESQEQLLKSDKIQFKESHQKCEKSTLQVSVINLSKKIKKLDKPYRFISKLLQPPTLPPFQVQLQSQTKTQRTSLAQTHQQYLTHPYPDRQVIIDASIYRYQIIKQRIDNDIDSQDQQISSGIRRLQMSLFDAVKQNTTLQNQNILP